MNDERDSLLELFKSQENDENISVDNILEQLDKDEFNKQLEEVNNMTKDMGIDSSYEGTIIAEANINKLLADIDITTSVKEQMVLRIEPLDIENKYEHFLMQARMCGVPVEVFLDQLDDDELEQAIPPRNIPDKAIDIEEIERRKDIGEIFEDHSLAFKENYIPPNLDEEEPEELVSDFDEISIFDIHTEHDGTEEDTIEEIQEEPKLVFEEEELELTEIEEVDIDISDLETDKILFETEEEEIEITELEGMDHEESILSSIQETEYEDDESISKQLADMSNNLSPVKVRGSSSSTYSIETLNSITGGSDEI